MHNFKTLIIILISCSIHASGNGILAPTTTVMRHGHRVDDVDDRRAWAELVHLGMHHIWNPPLSVQGREEIELSIHNLINSETIPTQIYASPMLRTLQSAHIAQRIIQLRTGRLIPIRIDQQFQEWRYAFADYHQEAIVEPELRHLPGTFIVDRNYTSETPTLDEIRTEALETNRHSYRRRVARHIESLQRQNPTEHILIIGHVETVLTALNIFHLNAGVRHVSPGAYVRIIQNEHLFFSESGIQRNNQSHPSLNLAPR